MLLGLLNSSRNLLPESKRSFAAPYRHETDVQGLGGIPWGRVSLKNNLLLMNRLQHDLFGLPEELDVTIHEENHVPHVLLDGRYYQLWLELPDHQSSTPCFGVFKINKPTIRFVRVAEAAPKDIVERGEIRVVKGE